MRMTGPWQRPDTKVFYFRKGVPKRLRALVGKREAKVSLGTTDPVVAKRLFIRVQAEVQAEWDALLATPQPMPTSTPTTDVARLSYMQMQAIAGQFYREVVEKHQHDPGSARHWDERISKLRLTVPFNPESGDGANIPASIPRFGIVRSLLGDDIRQFLTDRNISVHVIDMQRLLPLIAKALLTAHRRLRRNAEGDYSIHHDDEKLPKADVFEAIVLSGEKQTVEEIFKSYADESGLAPATRKRWLGVMTALMAFLKKVDVREVTSADLIRWKEHRLSAGVSARTVRDADIAAPKAVFNWAVANGKIRTNPASSIKVKVKDKAKLRDEKGFSQEEADTILAATLVPPKSKNMTIEGAAARRWIPWICAYTGARVNEITQMRYQDIQLYKTKGKPEVWSMRITPEAGTVKTNEARRVPIPLHLIEQGFLEYVNTRKGLPLFYLPARAKVNNAAHPQSNKVAERLAAWVRKLGVDDPDVLPNHGWRHRFRTSARSVHIETDMIDAIDGHAAARVADKYGDHWLWVMSENMAQMSRYDVASN